MKGTEHFKETIKTYLDQRADKDELFRAKYESNARPIEDVVTYILNQVQQSGCHGFHDDEIYGMAVHFYEENITDIGKSINCNVVINHQVELTEEEKAEQKALALKRFQDEELRKLEQQRNRQRNYKPQTETRTAPSLFDEL